MTYFTAATVKTATIKTGSIGVANTDVYLIEWKNVKSINRARSEIVIGTITIHAGSSSQAEEIAEEATDLWHKYLARPKKSKSI